MGQRSTAARLDLACDQVAANDLEWRGPPPDPDSVTLPQRVEPFIVADRMPLVFGLVANQVNPESVALEVGQASVIVDGPVADWAARQLDAGAGTLAVRESTPPAETCEAAPGGRALAPAAVRRRFPPA